MNENAAKTLLEQGNLDGAGAEVGIERVTKAHGHAFDETDESYGRRIKAALFGAEAAGAVSQPQEKQLPDWMFAKLRTDGPTLAEWIEHGGSERNYPPAGYASNDPEFDAKLAAKASEQAANSESREEARAAAVKAVEAARAEERAEAQKAKKEQDAKIAALEAELANVEKTVGDMKHSSAEDTKPSAPPPDDASNVAPKDVAAPEDKPQLP